MRTSAQLNVDGFEGRVSTASIFGTIQLPRRAPLDISWEVDVDHLSRVSLRNAGGAAAAWASPRPKLEIEIRP